MIFNKIVAVDDTGIRAWAKEELQQFAHAEVELHSTHPHNEEETLERIGDAECVLVSWNTPLSADILEQAPNIRYIGMCCSLFDEASSNVHIPTARKKGITVKGIFHYGDEGMIEFILSELIHLMKGLGNLQWKEEPVELSQRKLGIIGMGTTGAMLMQRAQGFGMEILYYSRSRKPSLEKQQATFFPLPKLLEEAEIISLHLPRNTQLLGPKEFDRLGNGKILVNTSLGLTFDKGSFLNWMEHPSNYAIFDSVGLGAYADELGKHPRIICHPLVSGWTLEAKNRLSRKVLDNLVTYRESLVLEE